MKVVFMGTPEAALPVLDGLVSSGHEVLAVYTRPDRPAGRGMTLMQPAIKVYAGEKGIRVLQPTSLSSNRVAEELALLEPKALIVAAFGRKIPMEMLAMAPLGAINIHPSLLPKHRGPSPVITTVLEGDAITGVTVMGLDEGMDTGPILAQQETPVLHGETAGNLTRRLFERGAKLLTKTLPLLEKGELIPMPQKEAEASLTRLYTRADGEMDWSLSAEALERRLRAFDPWPGCFTYWRGKYLKIIRAQAIKSGRVEKKEGLVIPTKKGGTVVAGVVTRDGVLVLEEVQLQGRRRLSIDRFILGQPDFVGASLGRA
jgi:methionyl-tRNA formyltransferase